MAATALWTTQWFNKPKFHILLHLAAHIEDFRPAIVYTTETFESYNYVIRLRSIHSNHHAPSVDIAHAFSHMHAVRHLISGGYIMTGLESGQVLDVGQAGLGVRSFLNDPTFIRLMGMSALFQRPQFGQLPVIQQQLQCS